MKALLFCIAWLGLCFEASAHGRSEEMTRMLNAPVPEWMSIAEPIKVEPIQDQSLPAPDSFRPRSGGATNSRNRVQIPERGIEFQVPYGINWRGISEEGYGVSLSPDGTKLLVNTGMTTRLYEILPNGEHREAPLRLPHVTYDDGPKGFILDWSWADNETVVGQGLIMDERGHETIESRIYVFFMKERALARLDLTALNLPSSQELTVSKIGHDLTHLKIALGDREFTVKADLKSAPVIKKIKNQEEPPAASPTPTSAMPTLP